MLDEEVAYDLVIVTVPDHQADALLAPLRRSPAKCVLFMFNTFDPERLRNAVGMERCAFGMPFIQASLDGDGRLKAIVGAGGQKTIISDRHWVELFIKAGLPAVVERDMPLWLRCHVPLCVAFESVSVCAQRRGGGASWREAVVLARGVRASFDLVEALGYPVYPGGKRRLQRSPIAVVAAMLWSVSRVRSFRELLATGSAECVALVDAMISAAPLARRPVDLARIQAMKS